MPANTFQVVVRKDLVAKLGYKPTFYDCRKDGIQRLGFMGNKERVKFFAEQMGLKYRDIGTYKISVYIPPSMPTELDWRPDSVIPEDYYAS